MPLLRTSRLPGQQEQDAFIDSMALDGPAKILAADAGGQNVATAQPWFPGAPSFALDGDKTYEMEGLLFLTTGATTHTTALSFTGTATIASIFYEAITKSAAADTISTTPSAIIGQAATAVILNATSAAVTTWVKVSGILRIAARGDGTFIPNFIFSVDPTGTILVKRNSYFRLFPRGGSGFTG